MTNEPTIPQPKPLDDRAMLIVDLVEEIERLRAELAALGVDYVILKVTLAKTIKALSDLRVRDRRRQSRAQDLAHAA